MPSCACRILTPGTTIAGKVLERSKGGGFFAAPSRPAHDALWSILVLAANWALQQKSTVRFDVGMADEGFSEEEDNYEANTIGTIHKVAQDVANIEMEILQCTQEDFKKLDEMLIQQIIKLDSLDAKGNERIKEERRKVIKYVQECMKLLDVKTGRCNENEDEI